jgi:hypothetical protein
MLQFMQSIPVNTCYAYFDLKNAEIYIFDGYGTANGGPTGYLVNNAGTNEVQEIAFDGTIASGSYKLKFRGETTATISTYTAAAAQAALEALDAIGAGNVTVTGTTATGPFTVTFLGDLAGENVGLLDSEANTLMTSGPVAIVISHSTTTPGVPAYAAGASTIAMNTGTGTVQVGDSFSFTNDDATLNDGTVYTMTGGNGTTGITFTPVLTSAVQDNAAIVVAPHVLQVRLGDGNFSYTEKKAREYKKNRGKLDSVRNGDEEPLEVKLDFAWIYIKSSTGEELTVEDVLKQQGEASTWVTAGTDPCEPYCVTLRIEYVPPCTNAKKEIIDLAEFRYEELQHDTKTAMIACTGKCNLTVPTVTRVDQ